MNEEFKTEDYTKDEFINIYIKEYMELNIFKDYNEADLSAIDTISILEQMGFKFKDDV